MIKKFNVGDLVRCHRPLPSPQVSEAAIEAQDRYLRKHMPHMREIGIVIANDCVQGCVVSFPSRVGPFATLNLEVL